MINLRYELASCVLLTSWLHLLPQHHDFNCFLSSTYLSINYVLIFWGVEVNYYVSEAEVVRNIWSFEVASVLACLQPTSADTSV